MNRKRVQSRSNQQLQNIIHGVDNPSDQAISPTSIQSTCNPQTNDRQLYKQSFFKIQKIKASLLSNTSRQLMQQLNDIIDLIKGERVKAKFTIQQLRNSTEMYEKMQGSIQKKQYLQFGINTDDIVIGQFEDNIDVGIQVELEDEKKVEEETQDLKIKRCKQKQKKWEAYYKLVWMIDKLKVDYRQILPTLSNLPEKFILPDVESNKKAYRALTNQETLKLQKVFIDKLNGMIQQKQKNPKSQKSSRKSSNNYQTPKRVVNKNIQHLESTKSQSKDKNTQGTQAKQQEQAHKKEERKGSSRIGEILNGLQ